jgi:tight adherence protein C
MSELLTTVFGEHLLGLALLMVFLATFLAVVSVASLMGRPASPAERRLRELAHPQRRAGSGVSQEGVFKIRWLTPAVKLMLPAEEWKRSRLQLRLVRAGYHSPGAMHAFVATKILMAIALPAVMLSVLLATGVTPVGQGRLTVLVLALSALAGFYLPHLLLIRKAAERRRLFIEGFPDALDMLVVCVEAGLGLDGAIQRVGQEMLRTNATLANEINMMSLELRAGKSREEALKSLSDRLDIDDVRSLTAILIQAERFGTSIARALQEHAEDMRVRRIQRARERAAKLPVKLIFPVVLFILPALFLVVLGPALVRIAQFLPHIAGGR